MNRLRTRWRKTVPHCWQWCSLHRVQYHAHCWWGRVFRLQISERGLLVWLSSWGLHLLVIATHCLVSLTINSNSSSCTWKTYFVDKTHKEICYFWLSSELIFNQQGAKCHRHCVHKSSSTLVVKIGVYIFSTKVKSQIDRIIFLWPTMTYLVWYKTQLIVN